MTVPYEHDYSPGLRRLAESFRGQESLGIAGNLLVRLARFLLGDPSAPLSVTSANSTTPQLLPDNTPALSAVFTVSGASIIYTMDGTVPVGSSPQIQIGSIVTLTGQPSLKAFQFAAIGLQAASVRGFFYT